ncbi:MAG: hypothetical protein FWB74_00360 [Defluviitaleaceae bacterium]|nr:hypothetical protein [Defluviitaleaceae bacterium]
MNSSKSTLQLIEQIVVIVVFAICAAVCVFIIAMSYLMTVDAVDTRNALTVAETIAENFKAVQGAEHYSEHLFFDSNWLFVAQEDAEFLLTFSRRECEWLVYADIAVYRIGGERLLELTAATRGWVP